MYPPVVKGQDVLVYTNLFLLQNGNNSYKYKNTLQNSKIVLTKQKSVDLEHKILATRHRHSNNIPNVSYRIYKIQT
jgi:hypothetical protein